MTDCAEVLIVCVNEGQVKYAKAAFDGFLNADYVVYGADANKLTALGVAKYKRVIMLSAHDPYYFTTPALANWLTTALPKMLIPNIGKDNIHKI